MTDLIMKPDEIKQLERVQKIAEKCVKCSLSESRTKVVFSGGVPNHKLMLIGEAPGANEDEQGVPFVGRAGRLLDELFATQDITRENDLYICNTIKCRPPENRNPKPEEKAACREYLDAQMEILRPRIILLCGAVAVKSMLDTKLGITKIRGQWFDGPHESKMMPIFHPSYLLRNPSAQEGKPKWFMLQDIQEIKKAYNDLSC